MKQYIQKKFKQAIYISSVMALGLVLGFALQIASAWVEPTVAPPGGNLGAPINVGSIAQDKAGQIGSIAGGAYGTGGMRIGAQTLNSNNNGWLYLGDANGTVYAGQGLAMNSLYVAAGGVGYLPYFYDSDSTSFYVDPNQTSAMNYVLANNLEANSNAKIGGTVYAQNFSDLNNGNYYVDPNGTSRTNYVISDNTYTYGNENVNDIYVRAAGKWASQMGGAAGIRFASVRVDGSWNNSAVSAFASCNSDEVVTGGGYSCDSLSSIASIPSGNGWSATCYKDYESYAGMSAYAVCLKK